MSGIDLMPPEIQNLEKSRIFRGLSPADLDSICQLARHRRIEQGEFFFYQDDPANTLFVLIRGQVKGTSLRKKLHINQEQKLSLQKELNRCLKTRPGLIRYRKSKKL